jgi:hypothetical protein
LFSGGDGGWAIGPATSIVDARASVVGRRARIAVRNQWILFRDGWVAVRSLSIARCNRWMAGIAWRPSGGRSSMPGDVERVEGCGR